MKTRGFPKTSKVLIIELVCVFWSLIFFCIFANADASATDHSIANFSIGGLTAVANYKDDKPETTTVSATSDSISVTTIPFEKEEPDSSTCGSTTYYTYEERTSTLRICNPTDSALKLTYSISVSKNSGSINCSAGQDQTKTIPAGNSFDIIISSGNAGRSTTKRKADELSTAYTISIKSAEVEAANTAVTFNAVSPINGLFPGSYNVEAGGKQLNIGDTYTNDINTQYTMTAVVNGNYIFEGWYVNGSLKSKELSITTGFADPTNTVEARFSEDPLFTITNLNSVDSSGGALDPNLKKSDLIEASSRYTPSGYITSQSSYGTPGAEAGLATLYTGPHGTINNQWEWHFYEDPAWVEDGSTALRSTSSGNAGTEYADSFSAVNAYAIVNSPVMRIKALQDVKITFDYNVSITSGESSQCYLYYYIGSNGSATRQNIVSGTKIFQPTASNSGANYEISVPAGKYLYLYSYGYFYEKGLNSSGSKAYSYAYASNMSNFKVTPINERYTIQPGFQDNTGIALGNGKIRVADAAAKTDYTIGTNGLTTGSYENVAGTSVELSVQTMPKGYNHIGWRNATTGEIRYTSTYSFTLDRSSEVYALFVPSMTVNMGANGYDDATYQYSSLGGSVVEATGQYIARNADGTQFYATLKEAFDATNTVVLLAGDTFNGDFTVPAGKVLVVPYGLDDDGSTTPDQITTSTPGLTNYVTVTLNGSLTVNGALVVSGRQYGSANGRAGGPIGRLSVSNGATITVNGKLCAFGAVVGEGHIVVNGGATVYELMEISDLRDIKHLYSVYDKGKNNKLFLFNSYFIKNIEIDATYYSGARAYAHYSVVVQGEHSQGDVPIIGTSNDTERMFGIASGSVTKKYDRTNGRIVFRIDEGSSVSTGNFEVSMTVTIGISVPINVDTSDYILPLPYAYELEVAGKLTIATPYKMLPGAMIDVKESGSLTVSKDASLILYRLNDYDIRSSGTTEPQGFSNRGYPIAATRFPGSSYASIRASKIGSTKLNVDGELIIDGGLYVTEGLYDSSTNTVKQFNTFANGYNNLTGTGTIKINKVGTLSSVYEAQQCSSQDDVTLVQVKLSSIKALPYESTEDLPENYNLVFSEATTYYGYTNGAGLSTWSKDAPVTLTYDANGGAGSMSSVSVKPGNAVTVADCGFSYGSYKFDGWNTAADGTGTSYAVGTTFNLSKDVILYAQWKKTFTVNWVDHDGTVLQTDENVVEGTTVNFRGQTPTRAETIDYIYTFSDWDPKVGPVTADTTYTAQYTSLAKNVKITHADGETTYFETVSDAVNAAADGETVVLLKDRTEPMVRIPEGKMLTINLNGRKLTSSSGSALENKGTLSIVGNGTVTAVEFGSAIVNIGTIETISGGTYVGVLSGMQIAQGSTVKSITGGTFKGQYGIQIAGTLESLDGAVANATSVGLNVASDGQVGTISGGSYTGASVGLNVANDGRVETISGGTFVSTGTNGFAVKSSSDSAIKIVASGSPADNSYVGPLFKAAAGTREGTVSGSFTYPTGMTISGKANADGFFYIAPNVFTVKFAPNDSTAEPVDTKNIPDWQINLSDTEVTVPSAQFTRKGWLFEGWGTKSDSGEKIVIAKDATTIKLDELLAALGNPTADAEVTLYAIWKPDKVYNVTVQWNGTLAFTYVPSEYTWNAANMHYQLTKEAYWSPNGDYPTVTVTNAGGTDSGLTYGSVNVGIGFTKNADYGSFDMNFYDANGNVIGVKNNLATLSSRLEPNAFVTATMKLTGSLTAGTPAFERKTIGTVALTLTPAS